MTEKNKMVEFLKSRLGRNADKGIIDSFLINNKPFTLNEGD